MKYIIVIASILLFGCSDKNYMEYTVATVHKCDITESAKLQEFVIECAKSEKSEVDDCNDVGKELMCPSVKYIMKRECKKMLFSVYCGIFWTEYMEYNDPDAEKVKREHNL